MGITILQLAITRHIDKFVCRCTSVVQ